MKKLIYAAAGMLAAAVPASAQHFLGVANSNWNTAAGIYLNPASIADSREKISVSLFSFNAGVDNSLGVLSNKGGLIGAINKGNTDNMFTYSNKSSFSLLAPYAELRGPSIIVNIKQKHSIALTTRVRGMNQFDNFDQSLYRTISDPSYVTNGDVTLNSKNFNYTAHVWSEIGLSYAAVILNRGNSELKVGATIRYLAGLGYLGMKGNNVDVRYRSGNDTLTVANSDIQYASNILSTRNALTNGFTDNNVISQLFSSKKSSGFGSDFGVVYDFIPTKYRERNEIDGMDNPSKNRYLFRLSGSVRDMGSVAYRATSNFVANVSGNGYVTGDGLSNNLSSFNAFKTYAVNQGFRADTNRATIKVYMPVSLYLAGDVNVYRNFYVNASYIANLAKSANFGNSYYNQVSITPRYDTRLLSIGLPITYSMLSKTMKAGLGIRVSGFYIGSDDVLAVVNSNQSGFNFYMGAMVPFNNRSPRDRDGDRISDRQDKCPDTFGSTTNEGCPDTAPEEAPMDNTDD